LLRAINDEHKRRKVARAVEQFLVPRVERAASGVEHRIDRAECEVARRHVDRNRRLRRTGHGRPVARQIGGARAFIAAKGWTLDEAHGYTDDGVSGALFANRAEFQRMMRDASSGAFEAVVFYDLDRFGRNARQTMLALNTLADLGVTIWDYSTGQAVDLDSFEGR
jgi:DNA invertase Pin-like site-specific DNA recombinase